MKTELSYYVPLEKRYSEKLQIFPPVSIIVDTNYISIENRKIESDLLVNGRWNISKYKSVRNASDIFSRILKQNLEDLYPNRIPSCTQLIIGDIFCRSDIILLCDILLNHQSFKAIMILPFSLCVSFTIRKQYASFIYNKHISYIDDFMLADTSTINEREELYPTITLDDQDFVEEFNRLHIVDESLKYFCCDCDCKEETQEKITQHILKEHRKGSFSIYKEDDNPFVRFLNRLDYLFTNEKKSKIRNNIYAIYTEKAEMEISSTNITYSIEESKEGLVSSIKRIKNPSIKLNINLIENPYEHALNGAKLFNELETSKEIWMTGSEWNSVRLRVLKEKLLFII